MDIKTEVKENQIIIQLIGRMDGEGAEHFQFEIANLALPENPEIILDLEMLTFTGSLGIGQLILLSKKAAQQGGSIKIINLSDDLNTLFKIMKLEQLFQLD